jgi:Cytochrome P460
MKRSLSFVVLLALCLALLAAAPEEKSPKPKYDAKGNVLRPADYRDWEFLSAGYGMNYSAAPGGRELFTNVFVQRWAYREFLASGKWPEQTMFVVDERDAQSKGSINKTGHFQTNLAQLAVEIKDSSHNPDKWAYYGFGPDDSSAKAAPKGNGCLTCHEAHGAVENTFVQFYPTLKPVAKKFGTYNEAREQASDTQ